jgi:cystathionine beta-synthase
MPHWPPAKPVGSVIDLIGSTPMVELKHFDTGPCRLFIKLESQNPGGSIKDRIALSMIRAAEDDGSLKPGGTIVEATAGNTGLALALVGALRDYKIILVVPDKMAREKVQHLRALGADVRITRSDVGKGHPEYYQDVAERIARETGGFHANQFGNPNNPLAHYHTTAPEIWDQMDGNVDAIVVGVGSGGTLSGIGRYFAEKSPKTRMVLADPIGSVLAHFVRTGEIVEAGSWNVEGIGEDFIPDNADLALVRDAFYVSDRESMEAARELLTKEGILAGSSSGTLLSAALRFCRQQTEPLRVVTFACDTGAKYLSKVYSDHWLAEQGLLERPIHGDLRDLVARQFSDGGVVSIRPSDTLLSAYNRLRQADVSQLPVIEDGRLVGILDESDILKGVENEELAREARFKQLVDSVMTTSPQTLQVSEPIDSLLPIFEREEVALIMDGSDFVGVITRVDLINHLRLHPMAS